MGLDDRASGTAKLELPFKNPSQALSKAASPIGAASFDKNGTLLARGHNRRTQCRFAPDNTDKPPRDRETSRLARVAPRYNHDRSTMLPALTATFQEASWPPSDGQLFPQPRGGSCMAQQTSAPKLPAWIADHVARYQATNGEDGYMFDLRPVGGDREVPTLLLTTQGRKTGQSRTLPLIFEQVGENYIVVASKGGSPQHPAWYLNLQANPEVQVQIKARKFTARARTAQGEERAQLWADMVHHFPPYTTYQNKTARQIPIVILDPST